MHDEIYAEPEFDIDPTELAWAAGLFEGEGCLTISGGYPRVKLNSTDRDTVERFARIVGYGWVREEHCQVRRGWKQQWEWGTGSRPEVESIIRLFWPYFGFRRSLRAVDLLAAYR